MDIFSAYSFPTARKLAAQMTAHPIPYAMSPILAYDYKRILVKRDLGGDYNPFPGEWDSYIHPDVESTRSPSYQISLQFLNVLFLPTYVNNLFYAIMLT